jgi:hypothetical protein
MAWTYGAAGAWAIGTDAGNVAIPATSVGRALFMEYHARTGVALNLPAGWMVLVSQGGDRSGIIGKYSDGTESGNLAISFASSTYYTAQMVSFITGAVGWSLASLIHATNNTLTAGTVDINTPTLTITQPNTLVLVNGGGNNDISTLSAPSGFTLIGQGGSGSPEFISGGFAYQIQTTATNISALKFDSASATTVNSYSNIVALTAPTVASSGNSTRARYYEMMRAA